jgi:phosphonate transport system substrate-binding protein
MKKFYLFLAALVAATMLLAACTPTATPTPVVTAAPTQAPTAPPPPPPPEWGTADKPLVMALAPSANTETLMAGGEAIAAKLTELTGLVIKTTVPTNYAALIEAMGSGNAQIGWLPPAAYIVAHAKGYSDVGMVTLRNGADHYAFQFVANADAGFTAYYDPDSGNNSVGPAQALGQFAGKKPCWTDPLSASGYLVPAGYLGNLGISTKAGAWVQGHPTVIKSVYLSPKGEICDFGATYVDARSSIAKDFPDVNDKVVVVWVSDARIPNDTVAYSSEVPADMRTKLTDALIQIASTPEGLQLLKDGGYSIGGLRAVDDAFFDEFRVYLQSIKFDFNNYK